MRVVAMRQVGPDWEIGGQGLWAIRAQAAGIALALLVGACAAGDEAQPENATDLTGVRERLSEGLIADRANAAYTAENLRPETTAAPKAEPPAPPPAVTSSAGAESKAKPRNTSRSASAAKQAGTLGPEDSSPPTMTESAPSEASEPPPSEATDQFAALATDDETALLARVVFPAGWSRLSSQAQADLAPLIARLLGSEETRIIVNGFARDATNTPSAARRLSLARAMAVRSLMVEQGIRSTRIELHALGADAADGPADRVDILLPRG